MSLHVFHLSWYDYNLGIFEMKLWSKHNLLSNSLFKYWLAMSQNFHADLLSLNYCMVLLPCDFHFVGPCGLHEPWTDIPAPMQAHALPNSLQSHKQMQVTDMISPIAILITTLPDSQGLPLIHLLDKISMYLTKTSLFWGWVNQPGLSWGLLKHSTHKS